MSSSPRYWDSNTQVRSAGGKRVMQPQTDDDCAGKRACALTARGSVSKAMKGLICRLSKKLDCSPPSTKEARALALIPPLQKVPRRQGLLGVVEGTKRRAMREQGRSKTGIASRQEHRLFRRSQPEEALVLGTRHSRKSNARQETCWKSGDSSSTRSSCSGRRKRTQPRNSSMMMSGSDR